MGLCIQYKTITDIRRKKTKNRIMSHVTCFSENYTVLVQKTKQNKAAANACWSTGGKKYSVQQDIPLIKYH